ncbi:MAG: hypothetical protein UH241_01020 [Acutalibacteraceae bacterium]|nr:hypothetical protein [Acutalibacteraceae bacterium]
MTYTQRSEDLLFKQNFDNNDDEDYHKLIELLNSEETFRTFGDGLLCFLQNRNPGLTADTATKYIEKLCEETGVLVKDIANTGTFRNWFKVGLRPDKGNNNRKRIFALAFALQLTAEETAELFHKVYLDRAFDYRNIVDIVCYFCIANNKSWQDVNRILDIVKDMDFDNSDYTTYTSQIKNDVQAMADENALVEYIKNHGHNLEKRNVAAKKYREQLIAENIKLAEDEVQLEKHRKKATELKMKTEEYFEFETPELYKFYRCTTTSLNHLYEVITGLSVYNKEKKVRKRLFKNSRLPKEIKSRFPEADTLSKPEPTYEELRKLIILLYSYKHWVKLRFNEEKSDIAIYEEEINNYLNESGFSPIYYGNPYDWLFSFCAMSNNPLDTFREIIAEVLEED